MTAIFQTTVEDALQLFLQGGIFHGDDCFDAVQEISRHPVGAADEIKGLPIVDEGVNAVVLQEASDNADHLDVLADSFDARLDTAVAAHDQADGHARLACSIKGTDDDGIIEPVHFGDDAGGTPSKRVGRLCIDQFHESVLHIDGGYEEAAEVSLTAESCEEIEEVHEVGTNFRAGGK